MMQSMKLEGEVKVNGVDANAIEEALRFFREAREVAEAMCAPSFYLYCRAKELHALSETGKPEEAKREFHRLALLSDSRYVHVVRPLSCARGGAKRRTRARRPFVRDEQRSDGRARLLLSDSMAIRCDAMRCDARRWGAPCSALLFSARRSPPVPLAPPPSRYLSTPSMLRSRSLSLPLAISFTTPRLTLAFIFPPSSSSLFLLPLPPPSSSSLFLLPVPTPASKTTTKVGPPATVPNSL